ncbi:MAG: MBL fold metallo-hydrolase [Candidatus Eremiobacteraeota bacterium]|nr:MBL fold metallo-hydrolase [Candidatus Eremiobacteraeota bacterium]
MLNCSPDISQQINAFTPLQPRERRGTPISEILLTDANVDHIGGLAVLRQSGSHAFVIRSSPIVRNLALKQPAFAAFSLPPHTWLEVSEDGCLPFGTDGILGKDLQMRAFPVPGTTPGYAGRKPEVGAVLGYEISDPSTAKTLIFAPVFAQINAALRRAVEQADVALLDGSFYTDDELIAGGFMSKSAQHLGHHPIGGRDGTLAQFAGVRARIVFTHLNNSNPALDPASGAAREISAAQAEVAFDGMEFSL